MKKTLFFALISIYVNVSYGQINYNNLDKESFLIGTLDDYMGHQQTFTSKGDSFYYQMVDIYYQQESKIALFIDSLFKKEYPDLNMT